MGTGLYELFYWTVNHIYYVSDTVSDSAEYYALRGFQQGNGNCMAFAATFYYLARFLGYDAQLIRGYVNDPSGVVLNHGWVTINEPDGTWVYDPEGAYELGYRANFYRTSPYSPPINYVYP